MHVAQSWRLKGQRYAMQGAKCDNCGQVSFPPREVCPHCANKGNSQYVIEQPKHFSETVVLDRAAR